MFKAHGRWLYFPWSSRNAEPSELLTTLLLDQQFGILGKHNGNFKFERQRMFTGLKGKHTSEKDKMIFIINKFQTIMISFSLHCWCIDLLLQLWIEHSPETEKAFLLR